MLKEDINNTVNTKERMNGQTWRKFKQAVIAVFENLSA